MKNPSVFALIFIALATSPTFAADSETALVDGSCEAGTANPTTCANLIQRRMAGPGMTAPTPMNGVSRKLRCFLSPHDYRQIGTTDSLPATYEADLQEHVDVTTLDRQASVARYYTIIKNGRTNLCGAIPEAVKNNSSEVLGQFWRSYGYCADFGYIEIPNPYRVYVHEIFVSDDAKTQTRFVFLRINERYEGGKAIDRLDYCVEIPSHP